eukprot:CAMPEP_0119312836 /NCGR_PEP_ID=MMETSP1333-20130426/27040_1 /TAXON_ID=418940 /ORGANISM="Scyphosphaera apsteinii, Strain RCC1455" /LENGTH=74 /DNA_ID=CAMNT_0007317509 /DNA_START=122 /DNA_END=346 /DNA_ORIENTATION=+
MAFDSLADSEPLAHRWTPLQRQSTFRHGTVGVHQESEVMYDAAELCKRGMLGVFLMWWSHEICMGMCVHVDESD